MVVHLFFQYYSRLRSSELLTWPDPLHFILAGRVHDLTGIPATQRPPSLHLLAEVFRGLEVEEEVSVAKRVLAMIRSAVTAPPFRASGGIRSGSSGSSSSSSSNGLALLVVGFGALAAIGDAPFRWWETGWRALLGELLRGAFSLLLQIVLALALLWLVSRSQKAAESFRRAEKKLHHDPWAEEQDQDEEEEEPKKNRAAHPQIIEELVSLPPALRGDVMALAGLETARSLGLAGKRCRAELWDLPEVWVAMTVGGVLQQQQQQERPEKEWDPQGPASSSSFSITVDTEARAVVTAGTLTSVGAPVGMLPGAALLLPARESYRKAHIGLPDSPQEPLREPKDLEAGLRLARGLLPQDGPERAREAVEVLTRVMIRVAEEEEDLGLEELAMGGTLSCHGWHTESAQNVLAEKLALEVKDNQIGIFDPEQVRKFWETYWTHWRGAVLPSMLPRVSMEEAAFIG